MGRSPGRPGGALGIHGVVQAGALSRKFILEANKKAIGGPGHVCRGAGGRVRGHEGVLTLPLSGRWRLHVRGAP